ncbi:MAG: hypothetical protein LC795_02075 [Acidobacteria bacterium]|nr:hypothetical protein [Acidobacteriota bacterium]
MRQFLEGLKVIAYPACFVVGMMATPAYGIFSGVFWGKNIQTLESPNGEHRAVLLKKFNLADINFIVKVDGERVYYSPDLMGFPDRWYRETLVWDKTGRVVVLELMGKRVFAYDTQTKRELQKGELNQYQLWPMPSDHNYADLKDIDE